MRAPAIQLRRRYPQCESRSGVAATEFALILPLLITLVLGCVDFGRFAHSYIAVTNAARAGAGFASFNPYTTSTRNNWVGQTRQTVIEEMEQLNQFNPERLTVTVTTSGDQVTVDVGYPFTTVVSWPAIPSSVTLRRTVTMRMVR